MTTIFSSQARTPEAREAAMQAALAQIDRQFGAASIHDRHKRTARKLLTALETGTIYPAGFTDLIWSLPQEIGAALHQVEVRLSLERGVVQRWRAGAWFLKPNPFLMDRLHALRVMLRWLRRHEEQAWREAAQ